MNRALLQAEQKALAPVVAETESSPLSTEAPSAAGVGIRIAQAAKSFGARGVFHDLSLDIAAGAFVAVVGRSGCGKTTLLRLIAGLETLDGGAIEIAGKPVAGLRADVRLLFQEPRLLPWQRVISNVGIARGSGWRALAQAALADVGLGDRANDWPSVLSGGQRQRVALARALAVEPDILLMDEPFAALDAITREQLQDELARIHAATGKTIVFVTHSIDEAVYLADEVVAITGTPGTFAKAIRITSPRPRKRDSAEIAGLASRLREELLETPAA